MKRATIVGQLFKESIFDLLNRIGFAEVMLTSWHADPNYIDVFTFKYR
ncbi:hypothetical protein PLUTE_a4541 [Pseudoalteromonas luteoviolacea DSM 6061]|nr:hypothetical protein [Pseudoalteromonas luteoviolacea DSM 6061]